MERSERRKQSTGELQPGWVQRWRNNHLTAKAERLHSSLKNLEPLEADDQSLTIESTVYGFKLNLDSRASNTTFVLGVTFDDEGLQAPFIWADKWMWDEEDSLSPSEIIHFRGDRAHNELSGFEVHRGLNQIANLINSQLLADHPLPEL